MKQLLIGLAAALYALVAPNLAAGATSNTPWSAEICQLKLSAVNIGTPYTGANGKANCQAAANPYAEGRTTSGNYFCHCITGARVTYTAAPPAQDWTRVAAEGASFTVPADTTVRYGAGTAFNIRIVSGTIVCGNTALGPDPAMEVPKVCDRWTGAGTPPPPNGGTTPPVDPPPVDPPTGVVTYHFSDCQTGADPSCVPGNNANAGTQASPKQTLAGINVNTLSAGSQLLFSRSGSWNWTSTLRLDNRNTTAAAPLTFGAYGTGPGPLMRVSSAFFIETGENENTALDGGYVIRGIRFEGLATAPPDAKAFFLRGALQDMLFEDNEFTGFFIALYSQGGGNNNAQRVTVRNNRFIANKSMGVLGSFNNSLFEGNLFERNNLTGSGFEHGTYFSNLSGLTLRNNTYLNNSVVDGTCTGGNMTFHGQITGLVIEGNRIEQTGPSIGGCWLMSITQGYATAEWFRNVVVRGNKLINGGNNSMNAQSAPGILVEDNVFINTFPTNQVAISVGHTDYPNGDDPDGNAVVRNNTVCQSGGATGPAVVFNNNPGAVQTNNVVITGAAATTGVCALP